MRSAALILVSALCVSTLLVGCANPELPRGAPPDAMAPTLESTEPAAGAVNVRGNNIEFFFDEVVSERPTGVPELRSLFIVSPSTGPASVSWHRNSIRVRPRGGLAPRTTYSVTFLPGVTDLQNNAAKVGATLVFSTGPTIDSSSISGIVFDWIPGTPVPRAIVEAIPVVAGDSAAPPRDTLVYSAQTDSSGRFSIRNLPNGTYLVRGFIDGNVNRVLDRRSERFDTLLVPVTDSARIELLAFAHDSVAPRLQTPTVVDSFTVRFRFSIPVLADQPFDSLFTILAAADSAPVPIALARPARAFETNPAPAPTTLPPDSTGAVAAVVRPDSTPVTQASAPSRPSPPQSFVIQTSVPLAPDTRYILRSRDVRGLLGLSVSHEIVFSTPARTLPPGVDTLATSRRK